jgi:hypothetical protein
MSETLPNVHPWYALSSPKKFEIVTVDGHRVDRVALRSRPVDRRRTDDADEEPR